MSSVEAVSAYTKAARRLGLGTEVEVYSGISPSDVVFEPPRRESVEGQAAECRSLALALGTASASPWISPDTYQLALSWIPWLRSGPSFLGPDPVTVVRYEGRLVVEISRRFPESGRSTPGHTPVVGPTLAPPEVWPVEDEAVGAPARAVRSLIEGATAGSTSASAAAAREVRELSGLPAERLGAIFPVERESFQRWVAGTNPGRANLERLLALRHFLRALRERVADPKTWLISPLSTLEDQTPYDVLRTGGLTSLWTEISGLSPSAAPTERFVDAEGNTGLLVRGSLRADDTPTPAEELDDYDEWLDGD